MDCYEIKGGKALHGEYRVSGAKNSALPIMAAAICRGGIYEIYDCPHIGDVETMLKILEKIGVKWYWQDDCLVLDTRVISDCTVESSLMSKMRSSVLLMGALVSRLGEASITRPGGCKIGARPIDMHISGLKNLGVSITSQGDEIHCSGRCQGGMSMLPYPSVGATENLIMAAVNGTGDTLLKNCAVEPEIVDLQGFLRTCGFQVYGGGTDTVFIRGMGNYRQSNGAFMYFLMEDRIEAATYMMAAVGTKGKVTLLNIREEICHEVTQVLKKMGAKIKAYDDIIEADGNVSLKSPGFVVTRPYPGFPTDCQPQLMGLVCRAEGLTTIREEIFEGRFTHKNDLDNMGADIEICGKNAIIKGITNLKGAEVSAKDLRGGMALILAGLMAEGTTVIKDIEHIERGYQEPDKVIRQLGGLIERREY